MLPSVHTVTVPPPQIAADSPDTRQIVMTSVYEEEDKTEEEGKKLEEMELSYITKKITVEGEEMSTAVDERDYQKVLQAMKDESARDES